MVDGGGLRQTTKHEGLALALSCVWCGLGQLYVGQVWKGGGLMALFVGLIQVLAHQDQREQSGRTWTLLIFLAVYGLWLYGMFSAYLAAERFNLRPRSGHSAAEGQALIPAGLGEKVVSWLIDGTLVFALVTFPMFGVGFGLTLGGLCVNLATKSSALCGWLGLLIWLLPLLVPVPFLMFFGRLLHTPGEALLRLQRVGPDGAPITRERKLSYEASQPFAPLEWIFGAPKGTSLARKTRGSGE